jgi:hypothetical protein
LTGARASFEPRRGEARRAGTSFESQAQQGSQLGRELLEGIDPAPYAEWQRLALAHAQPYAEYVKLLA